ncbi:MAG: tRNA-dihydrouridine synthase, partial [Planktomarina sp.]
VHDMKREFPNMHLSVNGGVGDISQCSQHLDRGLDGVMVGRSAYQTPFAMLSEVDQRIFGKPGGKTALEVGHAMTPYIDAHVSGGGRIHQVTRHMFGLFAGQPGARNWRQSLTRIGSDQASTVRDYVALLDDMAEKAAAAQEYLQQMGAG